VQTSSGLGRLDWNGRPLKVLTAQLANGAAKLNVSYFFWINGRTTANSYVAEFWIAYAKVTGRRDDAALVLLYTPQPELRDRSDAVLRDFAAEMSPAISHALEQAWASDQ
jgi:EpsI family protein